MMTFGDRKRLLISLFVLALLFIGVGYAYITSNLSITGATEIASNSWDIHFANLIVSDGSVAATIPAAVDPTDPTSITYTVLLARPKDYYEFTVDMVNAGSLPGKISLVGINGITAEAEDIVDYSVNYTNDTPVQVGDILNGGSSKSIKVRVFYNDDITAEDLPDTNLNLTLTFILEYVQSEKDELPTMNSIITNLVNNNESCIYKYTGQVTDQVGVTKTAENVYFNRCADKRNIIFNNMCWQMIRTTETGGIKMVYNGDVVDGKCLNTRGDHKGIVGADGSTQTLNAEYLYGDSFTYDITNNTFTLTDTTTATWSDSTYEYLIGKFTCKNTEGTCTTLYNVNGYRSNTTAYTSSYTIGDTNYAQIGTSSFNANYRSPAMVGYMFNKVYNFKDRDPTSESLTGNDVSYANGTYTLLPADGESELSTSLDATHHYTCNSTSSTCSKVRYYYYISGSFSYYIELDGEANIEEAVNNMLYNDNVNRYNSSIKGIIDAWYKQNLLSKTNMLEDTVYCNARDMTNQSTNSWNKDGNLSAYMYFKNQTLNNDLSCINVTDQFAVSNNKAKLTYPVALLEDEEIYNINTPSLMATGTIWWGLSPDLFDSNANVRNVYTVGSLGFNLVNISYGSRPAVSLSTGAVISSGTGSETNPWVVE